MCSGRALPHRVIRQKKSNRTTKLRSQNSGELSLENHENLSITFLCFSLPTSLLLCSHFYVPARMVLHLSPSKKEARERSGKPETLMGIRVERTRELRTKKRH